MTFKLNLIHSIPLHFGKVEAIEIVKDMEYEWRFRDDKGLLVYQSDNRYGNPMAALRDGLVTVIGLPSDFRMREIERVREEITAYFKE
jgi:hypothetical protein